jgi:hypothetical protein
MVARFDSSLQNSIILPVYCCFWLMASNDQGVLECFFWTKTLVRTGSLTNWSMQFGSAGVAKSWQPAANLLALEAGLDEWLEAKIERELPDLLE